MLELFMGNTTCASSLPLLPVVAQGTDDIPDIDDELVTRRSPLSPLTGTVILANTSKLLKIIRSEGLSTS